MAKTAAEMVDILTDAIANSATNGLEIQDENGRRKKFNTIGDMMKALKTWQDSAAAATNFAAGKSRFAYANLSNVSL
jgi:hypothetical protein